MAWIKSYQQLERHPKTLKLMSLMSWDNDIAIAKLHRFWWWCIDYAENGDISKYSPEVISNSIGIEQSKSSKFIETMVESGFFDKYPYLRVHDWWEFSGSFFITKYKQNPEKWHSIKSMYISNNSSNNSSNNKSLEVQDKIDKKRKEINPIVQEFLSYFNLKTKKNLTLTAEREKLIESRLRTNSLIELKKAVDNFSVDTWEERSKFTDIVYCIGVRNKIDNLEKWINMKSKTAGWIKP